MNIEKKAIEYAELKYCQHCRLKDNCNYKKRCNDYNDFIEIFESGYTQAVTDLSAENEKLREALRELIEDIEEREYGECFEDLLRKAKQLITEENEH